MLTCIHCGNSLRTVDSRTTHSYYYDSGLLVKRRRECSTCRKRFNTYEVTEDVVREFLAAKVKLDALRDAVSGGNRLVESPKLNTIAKAIEYFSKKDST